MKIPNLLCILSHALCFLVTEAYDIRCIWPDKFTKDPFKALHFGTFSDDFLSQYQVETPIVIRGSQHSTMCRAMCLSLHDPDVKDPYNKMPTWTVPLFGQNAHSIILCIGQCNLYPSSGVFDYIEQAMEYLTTELGLEVTLPFTRPDIKRAWISFITRGDDQPMIDIMENDPIPYNPYLMGHIAGYYVRHYADRDGWNFSGDMTWDRETGMAVPCTGSCRMYQNTVGYKPKPNPRIHTSYSTDSTKYNCTGYCRNWQPLQEGNDGGTLKRQEFITPHIGEKGYRFLRQENPIVLEDPMYDLYHDSLQVIREVQMTIFDPYRQEAVKFYDNKLRVRGMIKGEFRNKFGKDLGVLSFQDELINLIGIMTAEYEALLQAWHEKKHHDLVRPTTVIKHWGDDVIMTQTDGTQIKARDFEAYIRVMPHAEFPSGSSCLCTAYYEYTDTLSKAWYNDTLTDIEWKDGYTVANLEELRDLCGASRIWGGMHYVEAIEGGNVACSGIGELAYAWVMDLKNGATFDNAYYYGDGLGECPDRKN